MLLEINGAELEFDIFDAETAEKYEVALNNMSVAGEEASKIGKEGKLSECIRAQCEGVFDFFDDIFGTGTAEIVFGEKTNLRICLDAAAKVINSVDEQQKELKDLQEQFGITEQNPAHLNRAQRRAAMRK